jgi:WD40 repeat protein
MPNFLQRNLNLDQNINHFKSKSKKLTESDDFSKNLRNSEMILTSSQNYIATIDCNGLVKIRKFSNDNISLIDDKFSIPTGDLKNQLISISFNPCDESLIAGLDKNNFLNIIKLTDDSQFTTELRIELLKKSSVQASCFKWSPTNPNLIFFIKSDNEEIFICDVNLQSFFSLKSGQNKIINSEWSFDSEFIINSLSNDSILLTDLTSNKNYKISTRINEKAIFLKSDEKNYYVFGCGISKNQSEIALFQIDILVI